jgi:3-methyladenine DNA glycosylase/8-oxoguanine DNA glycosylase
LPLDVIRASEEELRAAGLSRNKAIAIKDLAEFALAQKLPDENKIKQMTNEEIIETLTQIKGIGRWTVEMILIFRLGRADVTSLKDYGLQKGLALLSGNYPTLPSISEFREQSEKWKPYRSIATWYLWRVADSYNATNKK